jgi:putative transcriptional regulator
MGHRYYTEDDIRLFNCIKELKEQGMLLKELKEKGYNTSRLRKDKIMGEATIQKIRENQLVSWANMDTICGLLDCNVGDIVEFKKES